MPFGAYFASAPSASGTGWTTGVETVVSGTTITGICAPVCGSTTPPTACVVVVSAKVVAMLGPPAPWTAT